MNKKKIEENHHNQKEYKHYIRNSSSSVSSIFIFNNNNNNRQQKVRMIYNMYLDVFDCVCACVHMFQTIYRIWPQAIFTLFIGEYHKTRLLLMFIIISTVVCVGVVVSLSSHCFHRICFHLKL